MKKQQREFLKLVLIILLIIIIPLIFISLEIMQKLRENNDTEPVATSLNIMVKEINSTPKNTNASNIRNCLNEIFNLMNKKEYSTLYSLLTDDTKNFIFHDEKTFSNHMEMYLKDGTYSPNFSKYEKLNNTKGTDVFIVDVNFLPYSTSEEDILKDTRILKTDTFTIYLNDDLTYKFSFQEYIGTGKGNNIFENDDLTCKLLTSHLYLSKTVFDIEITNKTNSDIVIDNEGIFATTGFSNKYYPASIRIPANNKTVINFPIYTGLNLRSSLPQKIFFQGVRSGEYVHFFSLPVTYPINI